MGTALLCSALGALVAFFPLREYAPGDVGIIIRAYGTPPAILVLSPGAVGLGALLAALGTVVAMWNWRTYSWWSRLSAILVFSCFFLAISARGFAFVLSDTWLWVTPLAAGYLLALALPAIDSGVAHFLYREQFVPRTRVGRGCLAVSLAVGGSAGALGSSLGIIGHRLDEVPLAVLAASLLCSAGSIDIAFVNAWELWPSRPWAKKAGKHDPTHQLE